jgi:TetR/AcrR family transcriptional regulator
MRLTAQDRRQRLLSAALHLFAKQGYEGTTTRQVAHQAGVTEALLFRHFLNKEQLYLAVIDAQIARYDVKGRIVRALDPRSHPDEFSAFAAIGEDILRRNAEDSHLARLMLFIALENHKLSHRFFRTYISNYYEVVAGRIAAAVRQKHFRRVDPLLAARGFIGMFFYHFLIQELFGGKKQKDYDPSEVSRVLTEIWMHGMSLPASARNGHRNGHRAVPKKKKVDAI